MKKHRVTYEVKKDNNLLVKEVRVFSNFSEANNFVKQIKSISLGKPILEEIK